ncbi:MAG: bifunctional phosphopantothenoylcysteine decarboxylase/phosphopantothenate--cysteine ligase CoaBC [Clostridia bacterium]|nr:bifunctional phosphopantothenoylcysteine decarboxylase/phosphopantothenate--cysteine ligase CoaBC [Clostridia bacterium]
MGSVKNVVVGITGGIAAYKTIEVISRLKKLGYEVNVILTKNACEFVTPLTLETISNNPVITDMFNREVPWEVEHISLAHKADLFLIAPATANVIGKIANGIADDMLTTTILACTSKKLLAPAMNADMYANEAVQKNIQRVKELGFEIIGPESGMLACGDIGPGRMSEPEQIAAECERILSSKNDLEGKKIVVTAGPTIEKIDPVRHITNPSTGKMGYEIAKAARDRGADVVLVTGKVSLAKPSNMKVVEVSSTKEMLDAVLREYDDAYAVIKAAAPCDYKAKDIAEKKIKKADSNMVLELVRTEDIAKTLGQRKNGQKLIIFAAETNDLEKHAVEKCKAKNADMVVANDVTLEGAGFGTDTNIVKFIFPDGNIIKFDKMTKRQVAEKILDEI